MEKIIMYGKPVAEQIKNELKEKFAQKEYTLATFLVGEDPASLVYRDRLIRLAHSLGLWCSTGSSIGPLLVTL